MYIRGFDGLRALAMFLVFLTHKTLWGTESQVGFAGVWVFFLLSGFLISGQLLSARARIEAGATTLRHELRSFWIKRMLRIFPAYYTLLLLVVPFYLVMHRPVPGLPYYISYLSNFYFQFEPSAFLTTFAHLWTLAIEEQYYIFFAPLLLLVPTRFGLTACATVIVVSMVQRVVLVCLGGSALVLYVDSLVNFGLLALGGLIYVKRESLARRLRSFGLARAWVGWLAAGAVVASPPLARWIAGPSVAILQIVYVAGGIAAAVLLVNVYVTQTGSLIRVLEWRPVAYFGRISYGLYLYNDYIKVDIPERVLHLLRNHGPRGMVPSWTDRLLADGTFGNLLLDAAGLVLCFALLIAVAQISWMGIELPALKLRDRLLGRRPRLPVPPLTKDAIGVPVDTQQGGVAVRQIATPLIWRPVS